MGEAIRCLRAMDINTTKLQSDWIGLHLHCTCATIAASNQYHILAAEVGRISQTQRTLQGSKNEGVNMVTSLQTRDSSPRDVYNSVQSRISLQVVDLGQWLMFSYGNP